MAEKPLISVALVCYNHERFVAEALAGMLSQTYEPLEIVIVDDCSTDNTAALIQARLDDAPNARGARFIRNCQNLGAAAAFGVARRATKGDFLLIGCGDDVMLPDLVAEMARIWIGAGVSLVTANATFIDERSNPMGRFYRDPDIPADDSFETLARDGGNACCFGPAIGFEREIFSTFGWPPIHLGAYDIMLPFWAYLLKGARFINKPLLKYRVHSQNTSMSLIEERSADVAKAVALERIYYQHLAHASMMHDELRRLIHENSGRYVAVAETIMPLLNIQMVEMSRKFIQARIILDRQR